MICLHLLQSLDLLVLMHGLVMHACTVLVVVRAAVISTSFLVVVNPCLVYSLFELLAEAWIVVLLIDLAKA